MFEKICNKFHLEGLPDLAISKGGRTTLLKAVLTSILTYFLSIFKIPVGVCKKMENLFRTFFWKGAEMLKGSHLVSWEKVTTPRSLGDWVLKIWDLKTWPFYLSGYGALIVKILLYGRL